MTLNEFTNTVEFLNELAHQELYLLHAPDVETNEDINNVLTALHNFIDAANKFTKAAKLYKLQHKAD